MPNPAPWQQASDELAELRRLLDIPDSVEWAELRAYWNNREQRTRELGESLPDAIRLRNQSDKGLRDALQPTIEDGLRISVRRNPQAITEALFPLIGAMVRRAVAASMEQLTESVNQTLESSLSFRSLAWRWEASKRGVPFSRILLERSQRFRVDQAFLIDRRAGLLLLHRSSPEATVRDPIVISGMLTAIQDFVQDSFSGPESSLESVRMGEFTLWIDSGPHAVLTCVVRGACPPSFKGVMEESISTIHRDMAEELAQFDGDTAPFAAATPVLDGCLLGQAPKHRGHGGAIALWIAGGALLLAAAFAVFSYWNQGRRFERFTDQLRAQPGIVVTSAERSGGKWLVRGLRDPLAADPLTLAALQELDPSGLSLELKPYDSPAFEPQRASEEAAQRIQRRSLPFEAGSDAPPSLLIDFLAEDVRLLADSTARTGRPVRIHVIGGADPSGDAGRNALLAARRAQNVIAALTSLGIPASMFDAQVREAGERSVRLEVEMGPK